MDNHNIYYGTDFSVREKHSRGYAVPFMFIYYSSMPRRGMVASFDGQTYHNCRLNGDGSLSVFFNDHRMGFGPLMVRRKYMTADANYADGIYDLRLPDERAVLLDKDDVEYTATISYNTDVEMDEPVIPEEDATLTPTSLMMEAVAGTGDITILSTKDNDVISLSDKCTLPSWLTVQLKETTTNTHIFTVSCEKTSTIKGRSFELIFVNSQGIECKSTVTQKDAFIEAYGVWGDIDLNGNVDKTIEWASDNIALKTATATCTATYNNGLTETKTGTATWSVPAGTQWASVNGQTLSVLVYDAKTNDDRSVTVTATVAGLGGDNVAKTASITLTQHVKPQIIISKSMDVASAGETKTLSVTTWGNVGTLSVESSNTAVSTVSLTDNTVSVVTSVNSDFTKGRTATITVKGKSGETVITSATCALSQAQPKRTAIGAWNLTLNNDSTYSIGYAKNAKAVQLSASASRTDTYDNGKTKDETGTVSWSTNQTWATSSGGYLSVSECARIASSRSVTVTASVGTGTSAVNKAFTVTQAVKPEIVLGTTSFTGVSADGETKTTTISVYGGVQLANLQTPTSSDTNVATASISGSTLSIVVKENETLNARSGNITVTDGTYAATVAVGQKAAVLMLYWGYSNAVPTSIDTTNSAELVDGMVATIDTNDVVGQTCHWVAAKTASGFSIDTWKDMDGDGVDYESKVVGKYTMYYYSDMVIYNTSTVKIKL